MDAPLSHPHLRRLLADAEAVRADAERLRDTLSAKQRTWKPEPGVWSVADCFEHLRKIDKAYAPGLETSIERAGQSDAAFKPSLIGRSCIYFFSPDSRLKLKAPPGIRPTRNEASADADALDGFLDQQAVLIDLIRRADGRDLNDGKFSSPLAKILRFTLGEGLTVLVRHEQRHLGQAQRLTERADFPTA